MAAQLAYERLVFEFLVDVAHESPSSYVATGNLVDGTYLLLAGKGVANNYIASHSCQLASWGTSFAPFT